jgi:hypothetical protein
MTIGTACTLSQIYQRDFPTAVSLPRNNKFNTTMKFSMLAIAGAAIAAGVEGFSAVRTAGVRQVSGCPQ